MVAADLDRAIRCAPLALPRSAWSSRAVAAALGVSQSRVARAWAPLRAASPVTQRLADLADGGPVAVIGVLLEPTRALLLLELSPGGAGGGVFLTAADQRCLRTVLAAEFARSDRCTTTPARIEWFWSAVARRRRPDRRYVAVASTGEQVREWPGTALHCREETQWLSVYGFLTGSQRHVREQDLLALDQALRLWYQAGGGDFAWVAADLTPTPDAAVALRSTGAGPQRALADEIVDTIRRAVIEGRFAGGDRITDRYLATRLHTSRAQVRDALRLLEHDGLLRVDGHAATIPVPTPLDVVETYAARQALGTLVVRAAVRWSPEGRAVVAAALAEVRRHAASGEVQRTGQADIAFQDQIADASGLVRIAPVMRLLSDHLRIFLAVRAVDYAYPIEGILRDDDAIFAAIDAGQADRAAELWRRKMDDARSYLIGRLGSQWRR